MRLVVRGWRTFVKDEFLVAVFRLLERLGEDLAFFPRFEVFRFQRRKRVTTRYLREGLLTHELVGHCIWESGVVRRFRGDCLVCRRLNKALDLLPKPGGYFEVGKATTLFKDFKFCSWKAV